MSGTIIVAERATNAPDPKPFLPAIAGTGCKVIFAQSVMGLDRQPDKLARRAGFVYT
jgi:hypothetical protein